MIKDNINYLDGKFLTDDLVEFSINYLKNGFTYFNKLNFKEKLFKHNYKLFTKKELDELIDNCVDMVIKKIEEVGEKMNKEKYLKDIEKRFNGKTKEILINQVELFYSNEEDITKNKYKIGEDVKLSKGTFIHGIFGELENFDFAINNGFISTDFTLKPRPNKISNSVGMWNIQNDMLLKEYINQYSGFTISYSIGRGPGSKTISKLIPYHKFDELTEEINNSEEIWSYWGEQTKEVRFIPSLVSNKRQIAFILNMDSEYAKKLAYNDVWNLDFDEETLIPFLDYRYVDKFINDDRLNKNASTTDRESAIMFGLPSKLIEGVFVGRKIENDTDSLNYIKSKLPDCYICNLDGKVIM